MELTELRDKIDVIDKQIVELYEKRMGISRQWWSNNKVREREEVLIRSGRKRNCVK